MIIAYITFFTQIICIQILIILQIWESLDLLDVIVGDNSLIIAPQGKKYHKVWNIWENLSLKWIWMVLVKLINFQIQTTQTCKHSVSNYTKIFCWLPFLSIIIPWMTMITTFSMYMSRAIWLDHLLGFIIENMFSLNCCWFIQYSEFLCLFRHTIWFYYMVYDYSN